jgi:hypothetical protein
MLRKRSPRWAALFDKALAMGKQANKEWKAKQREHEFRTGWMELGLEAADREQKTPEHLRGRERKEWTRKEKKFWLRHQGYWPDSEMPPWGTPERAELKAKMAQDFEERRIEKGKPPTPRDDHWDRKAPESEFEPALRARPPREDERKPKKKGRAGVLW